MNRFVATALLREQIKREIASSSPESSAAGYPPIEDPPSADGVNAAIQRADLLLALHRRDTDTTAITSS
jgi:hypothetical protein